MAKRAKVCKNLNALANEVTRLEGKKKSVSVAQVKEVLRCLREVLKQHPVQTLKLLLK